MKLNYKQTVLVGFAFLSICAFWQMYDSVMNPILIDTFGLPEPVAGGFMAADNILALFLLPLFGGLSDRLQGTGLANRFGKRMPFIVVGTLAASALMLLLPILDNSYAAQPATWKFFAFIGTLAVLLITMGTYRSPAVALMPDVTPKPLRSKGNAIINLMGAVGGILYLIISAVLYSSKPAEGEHVNYFPLFAIVAGIMLASMLIVALTIRENELTRKARESEQEHPEATEQIKTENGKLPADVKRSLAFLLVSIALWFIGYNGVVSWFTKFAAESWHMPLGQASSCLTVATAGAIVSYIPVGIIASRVGRKKTILFGTILLSSGFFMGFLYTLFFDSFSPVLLVLFALIGVAWASINVNSLPMVVEMCKGSDVGKFTGYYYTFSMAAQVVTPVVAGTLIRYVSYDALFPYAAFFVALSCITMLFVKHGDTKPSASKNVLEQFEEEDA